MAEAREAYYSQNFDEAEALLDLAEKAGEDPASVAAARGYVRSAIQEAETASPAAEAPSGEGPSEADPSAGGLLVP